MRLLPSEAPGSLLYLIRPCPSETARTVAEAVVPGDTIHQQLHHFVTLLETGERPGELLLYAEPHAAIWPGDEIHNGRRIFELVASPSGAVEVASECCR